ncbi:MAG TPA: hypothetical protein VK747_05380 [Blastocatellia bacterium]|jgi:hypothetical protein|nr:hypothetical protein [Blastocatellia bacterium]
MFSAEKYRAEAAKFKALLTNTLLSPKEVSEFRNLEQSYTTLAENEEWLAINIDKTIPFAKVQERYSLSHEQANQER